MKQASPWRGGLLHFTCYRVWKCVAETGTAEYGSFAGAKSGGGAQFAPGRFAASGFVVPFVAQAAAGIPLV